jgi:hypothetical protein
MAVTNKGNRISMTAAADAVTGKIGIASVCLDHTAAATLILQNTANEEVFRGRTTTTRLTEQWCFNPPLIVDGIKASTLSAGVVTMYTV